MLSLVEQGLLGTSQQPSAYPFGKGGAQGAIVMDTTDSSKAHAFLNTQAQHAGAHAATYRGVTYQLNGEGLAFGMVDHLAVIGSESGLSRRRRHDARRAGAGAGGRLLQARRRRAVRDARPPVRGTHGRGRGHGSLRSGRGALGRARGEHLARPLDDLALPRRGLAHRRLAERLGRRPARL